MGLFHSGEPLIEALEFESELAVIDAKAVQDGGVHVADVDGIFDDVVAVIVGFAVFKAALDTGSGHPH